MSRHRDIRNMDYSDEYEGYDDVYGHSIDDDYYISPSNRQFLYNRENSSKSTEDGIKEEDEAEAEMTDSRLDSCIDEIQNILGSINIPRNNLIDFILIHKFDIEKVVNAILEDPRYKQSEATERKEKGVRTQPNKFTVPKLNISKNKNQNMSANECNMSNPFKPNAKFSAKEFTIPKIFNKNLSNKSKNFIIPKLTSSDCKLNSNERYLDTVDSTNNSSDEFNSLSDLVSNHLKKTPVKCEKDTYENGQSHNESENVLNKNVSKLAKLKLSDTNSMSSIDHKSPVTNGWHIDLSIALKSTSSISSASNSDQNSEKFEIPFVDCDDQKMLPKNRKLLPCSFDISNILKVSVRYQKCASSFGKALCLNYKRPKPYIKRLYDHVYLTKIKRFEFNVPSPDDIISSHLRR